MTRKDTTVASIEGLLHMLKTTQYYYLIGCFYPFHLQPSPTTPFSFSLSFPPCSLFTSSPLLHFSSVFVTFLSHMFLILGLLNRGTQHASVMANLALELLSIFHNRNYITSTGVCVQIRIGLHTGESRGYTEILVGLLQIKYINFVIGR